MPIFADQPYNASRIAEIGAGLERRPRARRRRSAPRSSACSPSRSFRAAAAAVAREAFTLPPIEAAESALLELVHAARERRAA